ncbi:cysteine--tRNA ligase [Herbinix luporum]|jgi:cysteinyl-tRNA synthetase|uniref:Cysteine--tRNA ligase n=1 Tax=Herbinix luporum TaxID=1679721 RepID=A0A0K8J443_9FIRM|nr:cysteine--tRNA ligase [Herbinix luporum]MDI9489362.1 cysteine--tRNA ligase [Bacillota bacterium]CUH92129.1 Cysteine-tRNA ligase [Herbinix luporum]HHT57488.1 cysteine--tRNA ligase [Herbinix luporum]
MKIYNTLTRQKEDFIPIEENKVRMYVCGPTVYNYIHIGNARPAIFFDTVRRYFEYKGYEVNYVSNFTDVDDKIINKALEEGVEAKEISERYIQEFKQDMEALNVREASFNPKATEEVDEMIKMIQNLIDKGHAYEKNGTVYFRTRSFKEYGKLSKKNIDDLEAGARIAVSEEKDDPMDFVLWKPKKEGEPYWTAPWGEGRPGWHIECSVMSCKYLGDQIDIHGGGEDLIFPHHENEIAQSEAASGKEFARYWMHNAFINIDNKKMSKSEGNFFTVREICNEFPGQVIRFFMLNAHYRSPLNFSRDLIEAAKNSLERIITSVDQLEHLLKSEGLSNGKLSSDEKAVLKEADALKDKFEMAMEDDFNTADAIAAIFELVRLANINCKGESSRIFIEDMQNRIVTLCHILGIKTKKEEEILPEDIERLIEERQIARKNRDFAKADQIRDDLLKKGIVLEDTREGVRWKRK